jgi:hypothetical protein
MLTRHDRVRAYYSEFDEWGRLEGGLEDERATCIAGAFGPRGSTAKAPWSQLHSRFRQFGVLGALAVHSSGIGLYGS